MKNTTTKFIALIAIFVASITAAHAQAGQFPSDWTAAQFGGAQNFKFIRTESVGNGMFRDVYTYTPTGTEIPTNPFYCSTCTNKPSNPTPASTTPIINSNTNINYDAELEAKKLAFEIKKWESDNYFRQQDLDLRKKNYELAEKQYKMYKRQGGFKSFTDFLASAGLVLSGAGEVMQGQAALDGKYGTDISINNNTSTSSTKKTDWDYGTTPPKTATPPGDYGYGNSNQQSPPIIPPKKTVWE